MKISYDFLIDYEFHSDWEGRGAAFWEIEARTTHSTK